MKKLIVITTILLCCFYLSMAQEDTIKKSNIFKTWISLNNKPGEIKGVSYEIKDSSILVSNSFLKADYSAGKFEVSEINYNDIDLVKTRIKNSVLRRALIGAFTGLTIGVLVGLFSGDDDPNTYIPHGYLDGPKTAGYKAIMYGIGASFYGAGIGALIGAFKLKIPIKGDFEKFNRNKIKLNRHSFQ